GLGGDRRHDLRWALFHEAMLTRSRSPCKAQRTVQAGMRRGSDTPWRFMASRNTTAASITASERSAAESPSSSISMRCRAAVSLISSASAAERSAVASQLSTRSPSSSSATSCGPIARASLPAVTEAPAWHTAQL
ncbi:MAG: hypothetical protein ACK559_23675, partial [bacterium]